jgi:hypothetical protein
MSFVPDVGEIAFPMLNRLSQPLLLYRITTEKSPKGPIFI